MKAFFILFILASFFPQSSSAKDLLISKSILTGGKENKPPQKMSRKAVSADVETLVSAIQSGDSGMYIYGDLINREIIPQLRKIKSSDAEDFCSQIGKILAKVDDYHLRAKTSNGTKCSEEPARKGLVGSNSQQDKTLPWGYSERVVNKKLIAIFSLVRGEDGESQLWKGFLDKARLAFKKADVVIIDIRGNNGGNDTKFREFAHIFLGTEDKQVNLRKGVRVLQRQSPEAFAMVINSLNYYRKELGDTTQVEKSFEKLYLASKTGILPEYGFTPPTDLHEFDQKKMYQGKVFILTDKLCASSCESIVEYFSLFPRVTRMGDNTAGMVSFGNLGTLYLENSRIFVGLSTQIYEYPHGQKIERVGFPPDVKLREGEDAMEEALNRI